MSVRGERVAHLLLGLTLLVEASALWPPAFRLTDHLIFWNVGRLLVAGRSPYDPSAWSEAAAVYENVNIRAIVDSGGVVWPYPPWTGYLFVPFGILSPEFGLAALHAAYLAVGVAAGVALARYFRWRSATTYALALLIVPTAQPFIYAERLGHFTSFVLAGVALALYGLRREALLPLAIAVVALAAKPQITALFAVGVLVVLVERRRWRLLLGAGATLALVAAATLARHPDALAAMAAGGRDRLTLLAAESPNPIPNLWSLAAALGGDAWPLLAVALAGGCAAACAVAVRRARAAFRAEAVLASGLILSIVLAPYVYSYDHVLLLPVGLLAIVAADRLTGRRREIHLALALAVVTLVPWAAFFVGVGTGDHRASAIVPLLYAPLLAASAASFGRARDAST